MDVGCSAGQMLCCLRLLADSGELTVNGLEVSQENTRRQNDTGMLYDDIDEF